MKHTFLYFTVPFRSVLAWGSQNHEHNLCFTHSLVVTQPPPSKLLHPFQLLEADSEHFKLERLIAVLYDKTTPFSSINQIRKELFCQKNRAMDKLPPTEDALPQHIRRAVYQAGI
ncbi:hypothetical protein JTB14_029408 [Gonioctena quinquepunctata]|nr:hypothetical protein JTB14_029408 [Gonioctena quinquepunctata]